MFSPCFTCLFDNRCNRQMYSRIHSEYIYDCDSYIAYYDSFDNISKIMFRWMKDCNNLNKRS